MGAWFKKQKPLVKVAVVIAVVGLGIWVINNPLATGVRIGKFFTEDLPAFFDWVEEVWNGINSQT